MNKRQLIRAETFHGVDLYIASIDGLAESVTLPTRELRGEEEHIPPHPVRNLQRGLGSMRRLNLGKDE